MRQRKAATLHATCEHLDNHFFTTLQNKKSFSESELLDGHLSKENEKDTKKETLNIT